MTTEQQLSPAATVILLRAAPRRGFEVFLTRRPEGMAFLGGMYCFPGGGVRKDDSSRAALRRSHGLTPVQARQTIGAHFSPNQALALWCAAARELFEEVGVLLAVHEDGQPLRLDSAQISRLAAGRRALLNRALDFGALLEAERLLWDAGSLFYFSHWQTPPQFAIRFDTRFFLAQIPSNQSPLAASDQVDHSLWLSADRALLRFKRGELPMTFPTFASLRTLADFDTLESLFGEFRRHHRRESTSVA